MKRAKILFFIKKIIPSNINHLLKNIFIYIFILYKSIILIINIYYTRIKNRKCQLKLIMLSILMNIRINLKKYRMILIKAVSYF